MAAPTTKENGIRDDTLAPYSDTLAPDSDPLAPPSDPLAPPSDTLAPYSGTLAPYYDPLAPDSDTPFVFKRCSLFIALLTLHYTYIIGK